MNLYPSDHYIKNFLVQIEGLKLKPYLDSGGIPTIGIGHTGPEVSMSSPVITEGFAYDLFRRDASDICNYLNKLAKTFYPELNQNKYDAIFDLCYNWGIGHFDNDDKNLHLKDIIQSDTNDPVIGQIWIQLGLHDAHGNALPGLILRRKNEIALYYSNEGADYHFNWHLK